MINKELIFDKHTPLNSQDAIIQTYGCRYHKPDMCKNMGKPGICAFVRVDNVCINPPNTWKRHFKNLLPIMG